MRHNALLNDVSQLDVNVNKVNVWSTENVNHSALDRLTGNVGDAEVGMTSF